jgi:hypothetical protein
MAKETRWVPVWLASRVLLVVGVLAAASLSGVGAEHHPLADGTWWVDRFTYWDSYHLVRIAQDGYFAPGRDCCDQAWFPGFPMVMRALAPLFGGSVATAALAVVWLASTAAGFMLWGVAREVTGSATTARRSVYLLAAAPFGVFFVAVYTEAVWLVLALLAWWCGLRRWWWLAGLAAAGAAAVRINGLFLAAALAVMYLVQLRAEHRWRRPGADVLPLAIPAVPVIAYAAWLHGRTGSWKAWHDAEVRGWNRVFTWPWESLANQLAAIAEGHGFLQLTRSVDLVIMVGGVTLVVLAAHRRRWPEATFLALSVAVMLTSPNYDSIGRYALSWFPAYWLVAELGEHPRMRWLPATLIALGAALAVVVTTLFAQRHWVG